MLPLQADHIYVHHCTLCVFVERMCEWVNAHLVGVGLWLNFRHSSRFLLLNFLLCGRKISDDRFHGWRGQSIYSPPLFRYVTHTDNPPITTTTTTTHTHTHTHTQPTAPIMLFAKCFQYHIIWFMSSITVCALIRLSATYFNYSRLHDEYATQFVLKIVFTQFCTTLCWKNN